MKAARLAAASVHHLVSLEVSPEASLEVALEVARDPRALRRAARWAGWAGDGVVVPVLADTAIAPFSSMYDVPVCCSYTSYRYGVHPYLYGV
jgi:hypothetical protein